MRQSLRHHSIRPSHPAEIIADTLPATGLNKVEFAKALGISRNTLYNLLDQKQGVTAEMAVRLEKYPFCRRLYENTTSQSHRPGSAGGVRPAGIAGGYSNRLPK